MFHNFNFIDYIILGIIAFSIIMGFLHGFLRSMISLMIWIGAFFVAAYYGPHLATTFSLLSSSPNVQLWLSYGAIFFCAIAIGFVIKLILNLILSAAEGIGVVDRFVGSIFGCVRGAIIIILFLWFAFLVGITQNQALQQSQLVPFFSDMLTSIENYFPSINQNAQNAVDVIKNSNVVQQSKSLINKASGQPANAQTPSTNTTSTQN